MTRIILPSLLRLSIGCLFLVTLFVAVVQSSSVLKMFFDVLALAFLENIDDVVFGLAKRGERNFQKIVIAFSLLSNIPKSFQGSLVVNSGLQPDHISSKAAEKHIDFDDGQSAVSGSFT
jgi:hypothetical protein